MYTKQQAERGRQVYVRSCSNCHGPELNGGELAPALIGDGFLEWWYGLSVGQLLEQVRTSMPDDNPGGLSGREYFDVVAYLLERNTFPAGDRELGGDPTELGEVLIEQGQPK